MSIFARVKWTAKILALYIFVLAVVPCTDAMSCSHVADVAYQLMEEQLYSGASSTHNHSHEDDTCTPFCTCSCCGSIIGITSEFDPLTIYIDLSFHFLFMYSFDYIHDYTSGIWRPPAK